MPVQLIRKGTRFSLYAWGDETSCDIRELLVRLEKDGNSDAQRLVNLIARTADHGPPRNEQHCRHIDEGIYEFKAPNTARVLWFYDAERIIICTHGFSGKSARGKTPQGEIERAKSIRKQYLKERGDASRS